MSSSLEESAEDFLSGVCLHCKAHFSPQEEERPPISTVVMVTFSLQGFFVDFAQERQKGHLLQ